MVVLHITTNRLCNILNICHVMLFLCNLQREDKLNHTTSPSTNHAGPRVTANHALIITDLVQYGLVLRQFVLRRFTFTTLVQSDGALPTCGASLSKLKRPFCIYHASSSFPVCVCFFILNFSALLLSWLWFFHPWPQKDRKEEKMKTVDITFFLDVFWTTAWAFLNKIKSDVTGLLVIFCVTFYIHNSLN